jgi:hypothetical protein
MKMHKSSSHLKSSKLKVMPIVLLSALLVVCGVGIRMSTAQSQSEERELEDKIPKHLPIKIKIKKEKEKAFKDLKNEKWLRDFELEVTNIGDKPIYFLSLMFTMVEVRAPDGNEYGFSLNYGKSWDISLPPKPDDIPLKPGETYIFTVSQKLIKGWEKFIEEEKIPQPKKVSLHFQVLNFGDGTGFIRSDGVPVPTTPPGRARVDRCGQPSNKSDPKLPALEERLLALNYPFDQSSSDRLLAKSLPANFLSTDSSIPFSIMSNSQPDICCPGTSCSFLKPYFNPCYCEDSEQVDSPSCSDPFGTCGTTSPRTKRCWDDYFNVWLYCQESIFFPCTTATPTPTPTPTPSPVASPSPIPTPDCSGIPNAVPAGQPGSAPGTNCPLHYTQSGNCCIPDACPTPHPPLPSTPCDGEWKFIDLVPTCDWVCLPPLPVRGSRTPKSYGSQHCLELYLVTDYYISFDGGESWSYWYTAYDYVGSTC